MRLYTIKKFKNIKCQGLITGFLSGVNVMVLRVSCVFSSSLKPGWEKYLLTHFLKEAVKIEDNDFLNPAHFLSVWYDILALLEKVIYHACTFWVAAPLKFSVPVLSMNCPT